DDLVLSRSSLEEELENRFLSRSQSRIDIAQTIEPDFAEDFALLDERLEHGEVVHVIPGVSRMHPEARVRGSGSVQERAEPKEISGARRDTERHDLELRDLVQRGSDPRPRIPIQ